MFTNIKNKKGFTLIELIVVVAIIGILVAILVPTVSGYIEKARVAVVQSDAKTIYSAATTAQIEAEAGTTSYTYAESAAKSKLLGVGVIKGANKATAPSGYVDDKGEFNFMDTNANPAALATGIKQAAVGILQGTTFTAGTAAAPTGTVHFPEALKKFADNAVATIGEDNVLFFFGTTK